MFACNSVLSNLVKAYVSKFNRIKMDNDNWYYMACVVKYHKKNNNNTNILCKSCNGFYVYIAINNRQYNIIIIILSLYDVV